MRPADSEGPYPVVVGVVGALERETRALRGTDLYIGEGLEEVPCAEVYVPKRALPRQSPVEVARAVDSSALEVSHLLLGERADVGLGILDE